MKFWPYQNCQFSWLKADAKVVISAVYKTATLRSLKQQIKKKKKIHPLTGISFYPAVLSCVQLFVTPWTVACQTPLSMGFFRQEYWSGLPLPPPGDIPDLEMEPMSPLLAGRFFPTEPSGEPNLPLKLSKTQI